MTMNLQDQAHIHPAPTCRPSQAANNKNWSMGPNGCLKEETKTPAYSKS